MHYHGTESVTNYTILRGTITYTHTTLGSFQFAIDEKLLNEYRDIVSDYYFITAIIGRQ